MQRMGKHIVKVFLLPQHKVSNHNKKESKQNIILGYEIDMQKHLTVLECIGEGLGKFKCEQCDFKRQICYSQIEKSPGIILDPSMV